MPSIDPGSLIVVTGVNGHFCGPTALRLLQKGYKVRGTVRSLHSDSHVEIEFASFSAFFEVVEVPDIVMSGAFAGALKGASAVVHIASPVMMDATRPEEQFVLAVNGALGLLEAARNEKSVKKVLFAGSIESVMSDEDPAKELITPDDWNVLAEQLVHNPDDPLIGFHIYIGLKLVAEKAAWKFVK